MEAKTPFILFGGALKRNRGYEVFFSLIPKEDLQLGSPSLARLGGFVFLIADLPPSASRLGHRLLLPFSYARSSLVCMPFVLCLCAVAKY